MSELEISKKTPTKLEEIKTKIRQTMQLDLANEPEKDSKSRGPSMLEVRPYMEHLKSLSQIIPTVETTPLEDTFIIKHGKFSYLRIKYSLKAPQFLEQLIDFTPEQVEQLIEELIQEQKSA